MKRFCLFVLFTLIFVMVFCLGRNLGYEQGIQYGRGVAFKYVGRIIDECLLVDDYRGCVDNIEATLSVEERAVLGFN